VQVDPIKPMLKGPGAKRLKLESDELLSSFAFKSNLRHYMMAILALVFADFFKSINDGRARAPH